jgi:hypothetical protein
MNHCHYHYHLMTIGENRGGLGLPAIHDAERVRWRNDAITPQLVRWKAGQRALEHCEVGLQIRW